MIMAGDFRNGMTFEMDGQVYRIVEFQHVKPGKGAAFVRTRLKNVMNGSVLEKTFNPSEKYENAQVERREMQYLYEDSGLYYFMDVESYEQRHAHDIEKNIYCLNNQIPLIRIPYYIYDDLSINDLLLKTTKYLITAPDMEEAQELIEEN